MVFKVGDLVRVIKGYDEENPQNDTHLPRGLESRVIEVEMRTQHIKIEHNPKLFWRSTRFELVQDKPIFQVGDKVRIVAKVEEVGGRQCFWADEMDRYLHDGNAYTIVAIDGSGIICVQFENEYDTWVFLPECLELADKKPKAKVKPKKVKKLPKKSVRAEMIKYFSKENNRGGICAFAFEMENNAIIFSEQAPCHAQLGYLAPASKKVQNLAYSIKFEKDKFLKNKATQKQHKTYLHYMLNESPWAPCFKTKSTAVAYRYDILMDVSRPRHEIAAACIALREGSEYKDTHLPVFDFLIKKGFSGHTAFLLSSAFFIKAGEFRLGGLGGGHMVMYSNMHFESLIKFFKEGYSLTKGVAPFSEDHGRYQVFDFIVKNAKAGEDSLKNWMTTAVPMKRRGGGWEVVNYHTEEDFLLLANKLEQLIKG